MPIKSKAQRRLLWATNPELAREFEDKTPNGIKLPEHVKNSKSKNIVKEAYEKGFADELKNIS